MPRTWVGQRVAVAVSAVTSCAAWAVPAAAAVKYTLTPLGTLGGTLSYADGYGNVNASGQVTGYSLGFGNVGDHAFRTAANAPINPATDDLGTLGGNSSIGLSINASGQVVGRASFSSNTIHAVRTTPTGTFSSPGADLGTLGGRNSEAYGINDAGQAVGGSEIAVGSFAQHAFRTAPNGAITPASDLGTLGGTNSRAHDINNAGQTVGWSQTANDAATHAFRTAANGGITAATDLGTLGGPNSFARGINDAGQVVGDSNPVGTTTRTRAFRTAANGNITAASDLGTLGGHSSSAYAINALGHTVGWSLVSDNSIRHAFVVGADGVMQDLNDLIEPTGQWVLREAHGINDAGQIVGFGDFFGPGRRERAFLLTPIPSVDPPPTPGTVPLPPGVIAGGLAGVLAAGHARIVRRRRARQR